MNKRQTVILWIMGLWVSLVIFDLKAKCFFFFSYTYRQPIAERLETLFAVTIPAMIIGGLLIYTLRTRK